jgi:hypothetical protein
MYQQVIPQVSKVNADPLCSDSEAEIYFGKAKGTLKVWRAQNKYQELLTPTRIGRRVYYRLSVLENFLKAMTAESIA